MRLKCAVFFLTLIFFGSNVHAQEKLTLEQVIALALQKNYDVQLSENSANMTSTDRSYIFGAFLPNVNGTASLIRNTIRQRVEFGGERDTLNNEGTGKAQIAAATVQLNWVLFDGTKMFATRERIIALDEQAQLNLKNQMVNTIAAVIVNYYGIVRQKQQLMAIQEQIGVSEERVNLAQRKLDVGVGAKPELLQAKIDYNAFRTQALQQEATILQLKQQLNVLTGLQIQTTYEVADTILIDLGLREEDISEGIENKNLQLLSSKKGLEIANFSLRERRAELFPVLNFNAAYNFNQTDNQVLINRLNPIFTQGQGYNYGLGLSVPILNGFNKRREIQQSKINVNRQWILFEQNKAAVDIGLRNAYVSYDNAKKILLLEEETTVLAKENVTIALESFRRGVATFIELRTAQLSMVDAYNRLITARYNAKIAETELLRLNGGLLK